MLRSSNAAFMLPMDCKNRDRIYTQDNACNMRHTAKASCCCALNGQRQMIGVLNLCREMLPNYVWPQYAYEPVHPEIGDDGAFEYDYHEDLWWVTLSNAV